MRITNTSLILLLLLINASCVTQSAQKIQNGNSNAAKKNHTTATQDNTPKTPVKKELSYEPTIVELEGTLTVKTYYGPPNYGENPKTDTKEKQWILILSDPVDVIGNKDSHDDLHTVSVHNITDVQLVLLGPHDNLIGKTVLVKGTLFHGFTGHHHTDVLMDVQSISPRPK
jgi:hypothetical protein